MPTPYPPVQLRQKMQGKTQTPALNQNNCIQINNTVLKQETLQQLSTEQLKQIEEIVRKYVPVVEVEKPN